MSGSLPVKQKLKTIIYDEEQVQYLSVGSKVADAFRTGIEFKRTLEGVK